MRKKAYSIEHVPHWCHKMQAENDMVEVLVSLNKLQFECVYTNQPLGFYGMPVGDANVSLVGHMYVNRIDSIVEQIKKEDKSFNGILDAVLIDGRYIIACALKLMVNNYVTRKDSLILIHDYFRREYDQFVEKYYDFIDSDQPFGSMAVFRPKILDVNSRKQLLLDFEFHVSNVAGHKRLQTAVKNMAVQSK